ncbi:AAA family ATPase [Flavobacterium flavigenum]|uniref:AAA family ATPase n=1 Tax=Flavobacterium flavigenum TaxID=3003258 RepID=UPI002482825C|nr:AAA family ATPase [Flavobacterium flavigenum]
MVKILLFIEKKNFRTYKNSIENEGLEIKSITYYLSEEKISLLDTDKHIIDISSIANSFNNSDSLQITFEQLFPYFEDDTIFISDKKYKDILSHELRYCFDSFEDLEIINEEIEIDEKTDEKTLKIKRIIDLSDFEIDKFTDLFRNKLYGHDKFKDEFEELIKNFRVFNKLGENKVLSLFLMGDSGVGKTEVARVIHKSLNSQKKLAKINFGNYSSNDALNSLIGSPRGYIGSEGGELFARVEKSDIGLILIDEFEKSNSAVFNYFLDVLESGKLTNSLGEEIDVNGYIIVFTSNISKDNFKERISPELRSRFDYKGQFNLLNNSDKLQFINFRFNEIIKKYEENFKLKLNTNLHNLLVKKINVNEFNNMRDLNKKIKSIFVEQITEINNNNIILIEDSESGN